MYGTRIKEKREQLGLTRAELAKRVATVPLNIKLWEEERIEPGIADLIVLASDFDTTVDWLIGMTDDEEEENCELCDEFVECKVMPHFDEYMARNKKNSPVYIHVQLSDDEEDENCVVRGGSIAALTAAISGLLEDISQECGVDYYDLVSVMAEAHAKSDIEGMIGE